MPDHGQLPLARPEARHILFLQGPSSPFFGLVAAEMSRLGAQCLRVGACPGDRIYWPRRAGRYVAWRGRATQWSARVTGLLADEGITDLICLGDGREFHKTAIAAARHAGVSVWIVEHGHVRPGWILVEPNGTGGRSEIPERFARHDSLEQRNTTSQEQAAPFWRFAALDTVYHAANLLGGWVLYPHYRCHALHGPLAEWSGWIGKGLTLRARRRAAQVTVRRIAEHKGPVFVLPLQLETDYQIRDHAPPGGMAGAMADVINSFARAASDDALLVVKTHPMDNGLAQWRHQTATVAAAAGCSDRVAFLDGGDLERLIARATGCVTVNSTVGLSAAARGCPVKVLGRAVYDRAGITDPQTLDGFWRLPLAPEHQLVADFIRFLKQEILVPGTFDGPGARIGAENIARRVLFGAEVPLAGIQAEHPTGQQLGQQSGQQSGAA